MDQETLQALIKVYKARASTDLLAIIMDEAEGPQAQALVLELLHSLPPESLSDESFAPVRRKACQFCLNAEDFELGERLARGSDLPDDKALRARALYSLGRRDEAVTLYRQAVAKDPAIRNRELERLLGIRQGAGLQPPPAKVIPLTNYASRRDTWSEQERRVATADALIDDFDDASLTFADVAGLDDIKAEIRQRLVLPYLKPSLFERYGQKPGGNILLYGPPGCGKTLIARAAAGESDARFLTVSPEEIIDKYAGEAEKRLRVFFDEARSETPTILFFDDFEILAMRRDARAAEPAQALVSALQSELDGTLHNNSGVLVLAATNAPWTLDPALLLAGRFHCVAYVAPPPLEARRKIISAALGKVPGHDTVDLNRIAKKSAGLSGADLRAAVASASRSALSKTLVSGTDVPVNTAALEEALSRFGPSANDWTHIAPAKMKSAAGLGSALRRFAGLQRG